MSFDLHITIPDDSVEAKAVESVIQRDRVSPDEAVRRILRDYSPERNAAQMMIGLFSSDEDSALIDDVMKLAAESRATPSTRDTGIG